MNLFSLIKPTSITKVGFEDMLFAIEQNSAEGGSENQWLVINTLPQNEQDYLIRATTPFNEEEGKINGIIESCNTHKYRILIYGKNSVDPTVETKYWQLKGLGFMDVYIYYGGMFEWVMLSEIYGEDLFPVDVGYSLKKTKEDILLKWKPGKIKFS